MIEIDGIIYGLVYTFKDEKYYYVYYIVYDKFTQLFYFFYQADEKFIYLYVSSIGYITDLYPILPIYDSYYDNIILKYKNSNNIIEILSDLSDIDRIWTYNRFIAKIKRLNKLNKLYGRI